jgi:hypothetical protein
MSLPGFGTPRRDRQATVDHDADRTDGGHGGVPRPTRIASGAFRRGDGQESFFWLVTPWRA